MSRTLPDLQGSTPISVVVFHLQKYRHFVTGLFEYLRDAPRLSFDFENAGCIMDNIYGAPWYTVGCSRILESEINVIY